jgi:cytochrome c-type biogenesis protein CcmH
MLFPSRLFLVFSLLVTPLHAAQVDESRIDAETRELSLSLRCTVCQSENIWESNSPLAHQIRSLIHDRLARGEQPEEVRDYLQSRYGDYILMEPRKAGLNWLLWGAPLALVLVGGVLLWRALTRWRRPGTPIPPPKVDAARRRRIEAELGKLGDD